MSRKVLIPLLAAAFVVLPHVFTGALAQTQRTFVVPHVIDTKKDTRKGTTTVKSSKSNTGDRVGLNPQPEPPSKRVKPRSQAPATRY